MRPARRADSCAVLVVSNVKVRVEAQHSIPTPQPPESACLGDGTVLTFTFSSESGVAVSCDGLGLASLHLNTCRTELRDLRFSVRYC